MNPRRRLKKIYVPTKTKKTEFLPHAQGSRDKLVEKLKFEARVI